MAGVLVRHIVFVPGGANQHDERVHGIYQAARTQVLGLDDVFRAYGTRGVVAGNFESAAIVGFVVGPFVLRLAAAFLTAGARSAIFRNSPVCNHRGIAWMTHRGLANSARSFRRPAFPRP